MTGYDYVIVGAGSAGCVLANRLSEDPDTRVLLVEAGAPDASPLIDMPAGFTALFRSQFDWDLATACEPQLGNRRVFLPRGKVLGGSTSINAMIYVRGNPVDYEEWRELGWGWDAMLPAFKKAEDNERGVSDLHGVGGPLHVCDSRPQSPLPAAFVEAATSHGLLFNDDFNGTDQAGVGWYQLTVKDGRRQSTAAAYLRPVAARTNLIVETNLLVQRVLFDGTRAVGIEGTRFGEPVTYRCDRELIVSAGAYGSPQILTLSGLGRPEELALLGVPLVAESAEMGLNLQDHATCGCSWATDEPVSLRDAFNDAALETWTADGTGPLSSNGVEAGAFLHTRDGLAAPDVQLHMIAGVFDQEGLVPSAEHGFTLSACVLKPRSRGQVAVVSPDPTTKPMVLHNYLAEPEDRESLAAGLREIMSIAARQPLASYAQRPLAVPASDRDADLVEHMRLMTQTIYHPVGTCRMASDETSVVDPELRVRGVEALRVVDASVFPAVVRGNTNAPVIALAERAAELIQAG